MKKILFICQNSIENYDSCFPFGEEDPVTNNISVVFLQKETDLKNKSVSQAWNLIANKTRSEEKDKSSNISYQEFLEKVFSHDLSLVV